MRTHLCQKLPAVVFFPGLLLALAVLGCSSGGGSDDGGGDPPPPGTENPPVAVLSISPDQGSAPLNVGFDGTSSADPEGGAITYFWEFGNGDTSSNPWGVTTYDTSGTYTIRLTVTDSADLFDVAEAAIQVQEPVTQESFAHEVLYRTNLERAAQGIPPLKGEDSLGRAAFGHAFDMALQDYFDHYSLDGRSPWDRILAEGYNYNSAGENIAAGYTTPQAVVEGWMNSAGHRANILNATFRELGVGYSYEADDTFPGPYGYHHYWVQNFGMRSTVYPVVIENELFQTSNPLVDLYIYGEGWAVDMKISEDPTFAGASWRPFDATTTWNLSAQTGLKRIYVRIRNGTGTERDAFDEIVLQ